MRPPPQFSAYIMDERFPKLPMLKCDHLMLSPPMFCHALPASSGSSVKLLLGSHNSQEITMLQYSGQSIGGVSSTQTHSEAKMLNMDKVIIMSKIFLQMEQVSLFYILKWKYGNTRQ